MNNFSEKYYKSLLRNLSNAELIKMYEHMMFYDYSGRANGKTKVKLLKEEMYRRGGLQNVKYIIFKNNINYINN